MTYSAPEAQEVSGATFRQLDYWADKGWVKPDDAHPGSGKVRRWAVQEVTVATLMVRFITAGVAADVAADVARFVVTWFNPGERFTATLAGLGDGALTLSGIVPVVGDEP